MAAFLLKYRDNLLPSMVVEARRRRDVEAFVARTVIESVDELGVHELMHAVREGAHHIDIRDPEDQESDAKKPELRQTDLTQGGAAPIDSLRTFGAPTAPTVKDVIVEGAIVRSVA